MLFYLLIFLGVVVYKNRFLKGMSLGLTGFSVFSFLNVNCALAVGDEARRKERNILKWKDLVEKAEKDTGWRWYLDCIISFFGFAEKGYFLDRNDVYNNLIDRLSGKHLYSESPYCIEFDEIFKNDSTILWDSFNYLGLEKPKQAGEKVKFKGYDLFSIKYTYGMHDAHTLIWMTKGKDGNPVFLYPSGEMDYDTDGPNEIRELDTEKIEEVLPGMYNEREPAYHEVFDYIYKKFGTEVSGEVSVDVEFSFEEIEKFSTLFLYIDKAKATTYNFERYLRLRGGDIKKTKFKFVGLSVSKKDGCHQFFFKDSNDVLCCLFFDFTGKDFRSDLDKRYSAMCIAPEFCLMLKSKLDNLRELPAKEEKEDDFSKTVEYAAT